MKTKVFIITTLLLSYFASAATAQTLFTEDWDDGMGAMRWIAPVVESETGAFDGTVDFAFDYSTLGVASAPGSAGTTVGLFMEVNTSDVGDVDEGESVGTLPTGFTLPTGDFFLTMDVYWNVNNLTNPTTSESPGGTTEYGIFGVFASGPLSPADEGVNDDIPFRFGLSNGDGLAWTATGEGGAADDVIRFEDPGNADTGSQIGLGSYDDIPDGTIPGVPTGTGGVLTFGPEDQWVEIGISSVGGMVSFSMNDYIFDTFDNTAGTFSGGTIMLGYSDPFNSVNLDVGFESPNFLLIDNVSVVVPEPTGLALILCGLPLCMMARKRNRR